MSLYFLSLYCDLKSVKSGGRGIWVWKLISLGSLLGSALAYEVFIPFFLLNPLLIWYCQRKLGYGLREFSPSRCLVLFAANIFILIVVILFKIGVTIRLAPLDFKEHIIWFARLIKQAIFVIYGDFAMALPYTFTKIVLGSLEPVVLALGALLGFSIAAYLYHVIRVSGRDHDSYPTGWLVFWGMVIFVLGFAIFLTNKNVSVRGINNRVTIAAALGATISQVGIIGWMTRVSLRRTESRRYCFAGLLAAICFSSFLLNNTVASFWISAYRHEQEILRDIRQHIVRITSGTTLVLDGICNSIAGVPVFDSHYDLVGALQIIYNDPT